MSSPSPLITFENVTLSYPGRDGEAHVALRNLSLTVHRGEWVAVMGANGSGKSTLARLAVGLMGPTSGRVQIDIHGRASGQAHSLHIGYLSQHPEHHVVGLTVEDDLHLSLEPLGLSASEVQRRILHWLSQVGMVHALSARTDALSGGETQRVALAGALARQPGLLVLDEPNAFADPRASELIAEVVGRYVRTTGAGCIWVTHSADEAALADRIVVLNQGELVFDGPPERLWERGDELEAWGIGRPNASLGEARPGSKEPACGQVNLVMEDVSFAYPGSSNRVLDGAFLRLAPGEAVALVGSSGAGKSTLLHIAACLEQRSGGELTIVNTSVPLRSKGWRSRGHHVRLVQRVLPEVALAMQQPEDQLFGATVWDDLVFGLKNLGIPESEWEERVVEALDVVGLDRTLLSRSPFALSGGQRRKVALAIGLVQRPRIYLFDEPTAGLDYPSRKRVAHMLRELGARDDTSVLFVTHDEALVRAAASRTLVLEDGRLVQSDAVGSSYQRSTGVDGAEPTPPVDETNTEADNGDGIDPRAVVLSASLLALCVALVRHWSGLLTAGAVVLGLSMVSRSPRRAIVGTFLGLLPFMLIATLFAGGEQATAGGRIGGGLFIGLRMFLTVVSVLWVSRVLSLSELMEAFSSLLRPLKRLGFPLGTVLTATLVAIRMLPTLGAEATKVYRAQIMRGVRRLSGARGLIIRTASLAVPLSAAALRRAEHLGDALVVRGYLDAHYNATARPWRAKELLVLMGATCVGELILVVDAWGG